jgi:hypothetical protein
VLFQAVKADLVRRFPLHRKLVLCAGIAAAPRAAAGRDAGAAA